MGRPKKHAPGLQKAPELAGELAGAPPPPGDTARALLACHQARTEAPERHGPIESHPESPQRVSACVERLKANRGLWRALKKLPERRASDAELRLCHEPGHLAALAELARRAGAAGRARFLPRGGALCAEGPCEEGDCSSDTFVTAGSLEAARLAVGGVLSIVDEVLSPGGLRRGMALCRPPGHHASRDKSCGFCLVNNAAVGAAYALERRQGRQPVQRVLIFDWDVHHGQGTQEIFQHSAEVLVVSVHRHDGKDFYPATGAASEVGSGPGRGYSVNVALPAGYGGAALWAACAEVLLPAARRFRPDLVVVCAGFDAASGDPLGGCCVPPRLFGALTAEMRRLADELAGGRLVLALEGGYHPEVLSECVEHAVGALAAADEEAPEQAFARPPEWLSGSPSYGAIRRTCEAHKGLALRLPMPASKAEGRRGLPSSPGPSPKASPKRGPAAPPTESARVASLLRQPAAAPPAGPERAADLLRQLSEARWRASEAQRQMEEAKRSVAAATTSLHEATAASKQAAAAAEGATEKLSARPPAPAANLLAGAAAPPAEARAEASPGGELVLRLAPLALPRGVAACGDELWVWPPPAGGEAASGPWRWRLEGASADTRGRLCCAEFHGRAQELVVRLPVRARGAPAPLGAVALVPLVA